MLFAHSRTSGSIPSDFFLHTLLPCSIVLVLTALIAGGCGKSSNAVAVRGNVSYRGNPLTNGVVTFFPVSGRPVSVALSQTGEYAVELAPGEFVVTVMEGNDPVPAGYKEGDPLPPPKVVLPPEYSVRAKSTLAVAVAADQDQPIDFKLD